MYYPPFGLVQKPAEVIKTRGKCVFLWIPSESVRFQQESLSANFVALLSAFPKKPCPFSTGIRVHFQQESLSVFVRNPCPLSAGIGVRFPQE